MSVSQKFRKTAILLPTLLSEGMIETSGSLPGDNPSTSRTDKINRELGPDDTSHLSTIDTRGGCNHKSWLIVLLGLVIVLTTSLFFFSDLFFK